MKTPAKYYIAIALTVIDYFAIGIFAILNIILFSGHMFKTEAFEKPTDNEMTIFILKLIFIAGLVISIGAIPIITKIRQKLRDEYEYDENGISKRFGNFSKLNAEERKQIEKQKLMNAEQILDSATMKNITHEGEKDPDAAMDKMIGLDSVKTQMKEIAARMVYDKNEWKKNHKGKFIPSEAMHMIFMGAPGTGKTTVARIMAGFLYKNGYIKKNQCIEIDGNFFKGLTPGESSKKTKMIIQKSLGGVLFIDEAYSMLSGGGGQETIATIVKEMEDRRSEIVLILAGYDNEMKQLINSNPGIESRVKYYLYFGNYTMGDFQKMFLDLAHKKNLQVSSECLKAFVEVMKKERCKHNFGNARTVRNVFEKALNKHAVRVVDEDADPEKLTAQDIKM